MKYATPKELSDEVFKLLMLRPHLVRPIYEAMFGPVPYLGLVPMLFEIMRRLQTIQRERLKDGGPDAKA